MDDAALDAHENVARFAYALLCTEKPLDAEQCTVLARAVLVLAAEIRRLRALMADTIPPPRDTPRLASDIDPDFAVPQDHNCRPVAMPGESRPNRDPMFTGLGLL